METSYTITTEMQLTQAQMTLELNPIQKSWISTIEKAELRCALFCKAGSGKTPTILEIIARTLYPTCWYILARRSHMRTWREEICKWTKWTPIDPKKNCWCDPSHVDRGINLISLDSIKAFVPSCYGIVIDEAYHVKGHTSSRHKLVRKLCDSAQAVIIANADPIVASVMDLWGQMRLVLGPTHLDAARMREQYFVKDLRGFGLHEMPEAAEQYRNHPAVKRHSIWYHPPSEKAITHHVVKLHMCPRARRAYDSIEKDMEVEVSEGKIIQYTHAMEKFIKMHQVCGGTLPFVIGGKLFLGQLPSKKQDWLVDFCRTNHRSKIVVWCAYRHEVKQLASMLSVYPNLAVGVYMGGTNQVLPESNIVIATLDMGVSTNLFAQFPIAVYYSENYKYYLRSQSKYRTDRINSEHKSMDYYHLQCRDSIDEHIYKMVRQRGVTARKLFDPKAYFNQKGN